jgi:hypothetical protein
VVHEIEDGNCLNLRKEPRQVMAMLILFMQSLAYRALAGRIRGVMVAANALYFVAIMGLVVAVRWLSAETSDSVWGVFMSSAEVLQPFSSLGTIAALLTSRLVPIPFRSRRVKVLSYIGVALLILVNAWYSFVSIETFATEVVYDPFGGSSGYDYSGHIALVFFYPVLALVNIAALALIRVKQRLSAHQA